MAGDFAAKLEQAKALMPLRRLMEQRGKDVAGKKCPYCHKSWSGFYKTAGKELFKCFHSSCPTGTAGEGGAWDEVGFLMYELTLDRKEAAIMLMKEAGLWEDRERHAPSVMPGQQARKHKVPEGNLELTPQLIQEGAALARVGAVTVALLVENLELAEARAVQLLAELVCLKIVLPDGSPVPVDSVPEVEADAEPKNDPPAPEITVVVPVEDQEATDGAALNHHQPSEAPDGGILGQTALSDFFGQLQLSNADEQLLYKKRGLLSETCRACGLASNPETNLALLLQLPDRHSWDEVLASGLWLPADKKKKKERRPNPQFFGLGQAGKKPKELRRHKEDKIIWGMVHPVLIPYFDEAGKILKLRPHKAGAPGNTLSGVTRLYVPRDVKKLMDTAENFYTVVICEGEFKAMALWQVLGAGRDDGKQPIGVCAIPGINFGMDFTLREELDAWLFAVRCQQVIVAFDDQDTTGKPLRDRHQALIWARTLAGDLARKQYIKASVCVLPKEWRDSSGKADWDGALSSMTARSEQSLIQ